MVSLGVKGGEPETSSNSWAQSWQANPYPCGFSEAWLVVISLYTVSGVGADQPDGLVPEPWNLPMGTL